MSERRRLLHTAAGTQPSAFGFVDWVFLASIALMWGSSFMWIAVALESTAPSVIALGRLVLAAVAVSLVPRARRSVDCEDLPQVALLGVFWLAIPFLLFPLAQQWVDSSIAGMINGSTPLFAGVIGAIMLARRPGAAQAAGLVVGFIGVVLITVQSVGGEQSFAGVGLLVVAAACYGLALNLSVPLAQKHGSLPVLLRAQLVAIVVVAPFGVAGIASTDPTWAALGAIAFLGVLSTALALVMMTELAKRVGATRASVTIYLVPVVAVVLGATLLRERVTALAIAGGAFVLVGASLSSRRDRTVGDSGALPTTRSVPPGP